ncbi:MAG: FAM83 family protein [Elusimicrobiota bacterium]
MCKLIITFFSALSFSLSLCSNEFEFKINKEIIPPEVKSDKSISTISNLCLFSNQSDISSALIKQINSASSTLEIAIYSMTNNLIADAILNAYKRGVNVRIVIESSKVQSSKIDPSVQKLIDNKLPIRALRGGGQYGVMHNKIIIIDGKILITGSYNLTLYANNNNFENVVFIDDKSNIDSYLSYFNTMWSKGTDVYPKKSLTIPSDISQTLFTIINTIRTNIIKMIDLSQKSIDIAVYSISDNDIYNALVRARNRGVKIRIVTDRLQSTQSQTVRDLYNAGFEPKISDGFNGGMMHNKYAIFDEKYVITGSFNWSNNAENYNWENAIILDTSYTPFFKDNFETIYLKAKPFDEKDIPETSGQISSK